MKNPKSKYYQIPNIFQIPNPKVSLGFPARYLMEGGNWNLFGSIGSISRLTFLI
jgi:hypothetical protein